MENKNLIDSFINNNICGLHKEYLETEDGNLEVTVTNIIGIQEMNSVYQDIIESLFDEDGNYLPQFYSYVFRSRMISAYSDLEVPDDIESAYKLCFSKAWTQIRFYIDTDQYNSIEQAVCSYIRQRESEVSHKAYIKSVLDDLKEVMSALTNVGDLSTWIADKSDSSNPLFKK